MYLSRNWTKSVSDIGQHMYGLSQMIYLVLAALYCSHLESRMTQDWNTAASLISVLQVSGFWIGQITKDCVQYGLEIDVRSVWTPWTSLKHFVLLGAAWYIELRWDRDIKDNILNSILNLKQKVKALLYIKHWSNRCLFVVLHWIIRKQFRRFIHTYCKTQIIA